VTCCSRSWSHIRTGERADHALLLAAFAFIDALSMPSTMLEGFTFSRRSPLLFFQPEWEPWRRIEAERGANRKRAVSRSHSQSPLRPMLSAAHPAWACARPALVQYTVRVSSNTVRSGLVPLLSK